MRMIGDSQLRSRSEFPRGAVDVGLVRFEKILQLVKACRFGIHDTSRTELDRRNRLPRFATVATQ
jgi:hypothetical protein